MYKNALGHIYVAEVMDRQGENTTEQVNLVSLGKFNFYAGGKNIRGCENILGKDFEGNQLDGCGDKEQVEIFLSLPMIFLMALLLQR